MADLTGVRPATGSLRDDLASLKIERKTGGIEASRGSGRPPRGVGVRLLTAVLWLIPLALVGAGATYAYYQYDQIRPRPSVTVAVVQAMTSGEAETLLSAKGYIKSVQQAQVGAKLPGRVERWMTTAEGKELEEGDRVEKDSILAILEHDDLIAQLEQREAMMQRTDAELQEAVKDFELKDFKARRRTELGTRGVVTGEELETYYMERDVARHRVDGLTAAIRMQQAMIEEMNAQIENMKVRAPFTGTITEKGAEEGETITPGGMGAASGRGSIATLADLENLEVETDIAENFLSRVQVGQPAEITVSAVPDRRYRGRLARIIPMGDRTRGTVKVDVTILDQDGRLFPELAAAVHFLPDESLANPNADRTFLFVPKSALFEEGGHTYVWVVDAEDKLEQRLVEVVVSTDDLARVETGLDVGETVVLKPERSLHAGLLVKVGD